MKDNESPEDMAVVGGSPLVFRFKPINRFPPENTTLINVFSTQIFIHEGKKFLVKPMFYWDGKPLFGAVYTFSWNNPGGDAFEDCLGFFSFKFIFLRNFEGQFDHILVKVGNPGFKAHRHGHPVHLGENIVTQITFYIHVKTFVERAALSGLVKQPVNVISTGGLYFC